MYAINFITGKTLNIFLFKYDLLLRFFFPWYAIITMQNHVGYSILLYQGLCLDPNPMFSVIHLRIPCSRDLDRIPASTPQGDPE